MRGLGGRFGGPPTERGATLVEFAIIAPLLLLMLFGVIELARLGYAFSEVWNAAREGARYATTVGDTDSDGLPNFVDCGGIDQAALDRVVIEALGPAAVTIEYRSPGGSLLADCQSGGAGDPTTTGNIDPGTEITVTVEAAFDAVVPLIGGFFDGIVLDNSQIRSVNYGVIGD